ncbi:MAG: hypothetical protein AB7K09_25890 [Planctomycetota bacterium]
MSYDEFPNEFKDIRRHIEAEDFHSAEVLLKDICARRPDFQQARLDLERVQGKVGSISNYEFRIEAFLNDGDIDQARRILAEALQAFPKSPKIAALNAMFLKRAGATGSDRAPAAADAAAASGGGQLNLDQSLETVMGAPPPDVLEMLKKIGVSMPAGGSGGGGGGGLPRAGGGGGQQQAPPSAAPDPFRKRTPEPAPPAQPPQKLVTLPAQPQKPADTKMVGRSDAGNAPAARRTGPMPSAGGGTAAPRTGRLTGAEPPPAQPRPQPSPRQNTTSAHFPATGGGNNRSAGASGSGDTNQQPRPGAGGTQIKTTLTVNLPADLKVWIEEQSVREGLSPSALMRRLARDYRRHRELKDGKGG